jgi:hypothetical protein
MADADLRLPPHFPRVPKPCKDVAAAFFECFSREAEYDATKVSGAHRVGVLPRGRCACGPGVAAG